MNPIFMRRRWVANLTFVVFCANLGGFARAANGLEYNRDIRPILAENCFACHGPDSAARKAGLRLDRREDAIKVEAFIPGKADKSALVERIFSTNPKQLMPPAKSHKKLTAAQKETLKRWVAAGAEYQPNWSFIAPKRGTLPVVKNAGWARNPIDHFILAELEKRGLQPAPEADRWTLARRLSLDLTGLPPTPEDVEAFVKDSSPKAYENYVDHLLKSPHWGEHRGRFWLDAARYADTHGIHFDNFRENWAYRDWVIRAFNKNMPFDRFTIEQLAGDLLPNRTLDQQVASGFNRCNITTNEGGAIAEEYLVHYTRDRTETTAQVWMGLTANCAVCHDHKFDPVSQREFYELAAFFNNTTQGAMDGNIKDTPPVLLVPRSEDMARWAVVSKEAAEVGKEVEARKQAARGDFEKWLATAKPEEIAAQGPSAGLRLQAPLNEGSGQVVHLTVAGQPRSATLPTGFTWDNGTISDKAFKVQAGATLEQTDVGDFDTKQAFTAGAWLRLPRNSGFIGAIASRMNEQDQFRGWDLWVENGRVGAHIVHAWPGNAIKVITQKQMKSGQWHHVLVTHDGSGKAAGVKVYLDGMAEPTTVMSDSLGGTTRTSVPFKVGQRSHSSRLNEATLQDLRIYDRSLSPTEVERLVKTGRAVLLAGKPAAKRTPQEKEELFLWFLTALDKPYQALNEKRSVLQQEEAAIRSRGTIAHVMQEKPQEAMAYVLHRGDYDKRRDPVKPGTPKALPGMGSDLPKNRLGLAQWLLRPEHPLTARVTVNRYWQEIFGTGLVRSSDDFGTTGEAPSHPELLDWLAVEFRESGWDIQRFFKLLVTSAAYRQAAVTTREKVEKDGQNRLLSRGSRYRMDGEMIRDYALASSGLLVRKLGGPSVKPYMPEGVWEAVAMIGSNTRDYRRDSGENLYRRSMYTFWKRSAPPAQMEIFNAPNRETCTVRRERTNTPLQALVTLNDEQFVEAARHLAQGALLAKPGNEAGLDFLAKRLLARSFRAEELRLVQGNLNELLAYYKAHPEDAKKLIAVGESKADPRLEVGALAAWTMLANELMNLDEVLNK